MDRAVVITAAVITAVRAAIRRRQSRREWPVPPAAPRMRRRHDSARAAAAPWRRCAVSPAAPISRRARSSAAPAVRRSSSLSRRRGFPPQGGVLRPGLVARVPADQALAQWRARRDDQHLATFAIDLQPGRLGAEEHCSPAAVGVQQGDQRGELDALFLVEIAQHQVCGTGPAPGGSPRPGATARRPGRPLPGRGCRTCSRRRSLRGLPSHGRSARRGRRLPGPRRAFP